MSALNELCRPLSVRSLVHPRPALSFALGQLYIVRSRRALSTLDQLYCPLRSALYCRHSTSFLVYHWPWQKEHRRTRRFSFSLSIRLFFGRPAFLQIGGARRSKASVNSSERIEGIGVDNCFDIRPVNRFDGHRVLVPDWILDTQKFLVGKATVCLEIPGKFIVKIDNIGIPVWRMNHYHIVT